MKILITFFVLSIMMLFVGGGSASAESPAKGCLIRTTENIEINGVTIPMDSRFEVVDETATAFVVTYDVNAVEIPFKNCLINIKQFIPSIDCWLDMAQPCNMFNMANEGIDGLTNRQFYHNSGSSDGSEAWLRYEVATKLKNAQEAFLEDGYSIIIYDAYRPASCTEVFKTVYRQYLNTKSSSFKKQWFGSLGESWFLAQKASSHNYGIAVDMGLKRVSDGTVIEMPSNIHTLDKRSAYVEWVNQQNQAAENARYLKAKMESFGFTYLKSEWWHFQYNGIEKGAVIDIPN